MNPATTITGIPVELLFLAIAGLVGLLYADLKRGQRSQAKMGRKRDIVLARICERLGIPFNGNDDD